MKPQATITAAIRRRHNLSNAADLHIKKLGAQIDTTDHDPYKFSARITTSALDRDDEVLLPSGMDASDFDVSGAIYWNHDYDKPVAVAGKLSQARDAVIGRATFLKRPPDYQGEWFPDFARAFLNQMSSLGKSVGVSVGFLPTDARKPTKKDQEDYGDDVRTVYTRWKLLEWSIAPVQANPEAVVTTIGKSVDVKMLRALFPPASSARVPRYIYLPSKPSKPKRRRESQEAKVRKAVRREMARRKGLIYLEDYDQ